MSRKMVMLLVAPWVIYGTTVMLSYFFGWASWVGFILLFVFIYGLAGVMIKQTVVWVIKEFKRKLKIIAVRCQLRGNKLVFLIYHKS